MVKIKRLWLILKKRKSAVYEIVNLENAQKEIQKLREELAQEQDTKSAIGFIGLVGTGLAVIAPAVLKAMN